MPEATAGNVPFAEAIDFLRGKVNLPTQKWDDLRHGAHVRAFSVAGVTRDDMLADFRAAVEKARTEGTGLAEFRKSFDEIVDRTGWKFYARGDSEEKRRAWRARIIYKTNMRVSYMAGRYAQMTDPDVLKYRPYWQYRHSGALHPRKLHLSWDRKVWRADDPVWNVIFPPNGWGCGCDVAALSQRQLDALGKTGPDPSPDLEPYQAKDPRTGQTEVRYKGVQRGWEYNAGKEWLDGVVPKIMHQPLTPVVRQTLTPDPDLPSLPPPTAIPESELLPAGRPAEDYVSAFLDVFGLKQGESLLHRDAAGGVIAISQRLLEARDADNRTTGSKANKFDRGPILRLVAYAILDPDEIWVNWHQTTRSVELRRSYLKQFSVGRDRSIFVRFEWGASGWVAVTGYSPNAARLNRERVGALLFRRKTDVPPAG